MIELNESQLRSIMQTAAPDLYHAAYTEEPVYLTLIDEDNEVLDQDRKLVVPKIEISHQRIVIIFGEGLVVFRAEYPGENPAVAVSLNRLGPILHRFELSKTVTNRVHKKDFVHVRNLKLEVFS